MLYRVTEKAFLRPELHAPVETHRQDDRLVEPDSVIGKVSAGYNGPRPIMAYDGPPAHFLEPLDDEARAATEAFFAANPKARMNVINALPLTSEPEEDRIAASITKGVEAAMKAVFSGLPGMQPAKGHAVGR